MNQKKLIRKLQHLIYNSPPVYPDFYCAKYINYPHLNKYIYGFFNIKNEYETKLKFIKESPLFNIDKRMKVQKQIWDLYVKLGWTPEQMETFANEVLTLKDNYKFHTEPSIRKREKDNSIWRPAYGYHGNSNRNKIRYPRKCRKTAWKRFYKLFPHLKENDNTKLSK